MQRLLHLARLVILIAMGCSIGLHWTLLQSVAWSGMLTRNLRTHSFAEALRLTFDGQHPCELCLAIAKGKSQEQKQEFPSPIQKLEFVNQAVAFALFPPTQFELVKPESSRSRSLAFPPPKPPPRA